jgi:anaerobic ribonucleoside-triphosphate reductase activating protein
VLVDGTFRQELRDEDLLYRGSSYQRLVDVQKSLAAGKFVEFDYNPYKLK